MPTEADLRLHRCCFTGHRPEKIGIPEGTVIALLDKAISEAIQSGYSTFISGMARGVEIWAAEIVLKYRDAGAPMKMICASPFEGFETSWKAEWQNRYNAIMKKADLKRFICEKYSKACFQIRNEWMVNHSSCVIAVYNGETGGTRNTIAYANKNKVEVLNVLEG